MRKKLADAIVWYAILRGLYRGTRTAITANKDSTELLRVGNELRSTQIWFRDGSYYEENNW